MKKHVRWLVLGEERLGQLEYTGFDGFWVYGDFHPSSAFEKYRQRFETLDLSWEQEEVDSCKLLEEINSLGFCSEDESGQQKPLHDFKIETGYRFEHRSFDLL